MLRIYLSRASAVTATVVASAARWNDARYQFRFSVKDRDHALLWSGMVARANAAYSLAHQQYFNPRLPTRWRSAEDATATTAMILKRGIAMAWRCSQDNSDGNC